MRPPCPSDCPNRSGDPNCHESCERYKAFKKEVDRLNAMRRKEAARSGWGKHPKAVRE